MRYLWIYIAFAILLAVEAYMFCCNQNLKNEIVLKNKYIESSCIMASAAETQFSSNISNADAFISEDVYGIDTSGCRIFLKDVVGSSRMLICRFSDSYCSECVEHSVSLFTLNKESFDFSKILFASCNGTRLLTKKTIEDFSLHGLRVLNCPSLDIPAEDAQFPYIMAVDSSLRVLSVYFPTKSTHGTDYDYRHVKYMYDRLVE